MVPPVSIITISTPTGGSVDRMRVDSLTPSQARLFLQPSAPLPAAIHTRSLKPSFHFLESSESTSSGGYYDIQAARSCVPRDAPADAARPARRPHPNDLCTPSFGGTSPHASMAAAVEEKPVRSWPLPAPPPMKAGQPSAGSTTPSRPAPRMASLPSGRPLCTGRCVWKG